MALKVAAKIDAVDELYFHRAIEPMMNDPLVEFVGEVPDADKNALLGGAAALLFPIDWPEPFGLVMIEAMACGTPVIAWDHGSVAEVIDDGETGFVVRSEDEAVEAVKRIPDIDRRKVRAVFERRFSSTAMANRYLQVYGQIAKPRGGGRALVRDRSQVGRDLGVTEHAWLIPSPTPERTLAARSARSR